VGIEPATFGQGHREVGGGPGQIFFRGPYLKNFSGKNFSENNPPPTKNFGQCTILGVQKHFPDEYVAIAFQELYLIFLCQSSVLGPKNRYLYLFIYLALPTRAGSQQQHMPITVGPFYLTHPVNFPCGRKPEYPGKTHDFRQSVDFYSFHMRTGLVALRKYLVRFEPAASEVKGKCANHLATEAPFQVMR
jgi:hypothetical protein